MAGAPATAEELQQQVDRLAELLEAAVKELRELRPLPQKQPKPRQSRGAL